MHTVVTLGELLIDFVPEENGLPLAAVPAFRKAPGGAPANVAAAVAKLGGRARFVGKVGDDPFGWFLRAVLEETGVDTRSLLLAPDAKTTLAFVSLRADGERDFLFYRDPGADTLLSPEELDGSWLDDAAVFHFGSVSLSAEPARSATREMAERARERGLLVSYDPNLRPALWPSDAAMREEAASAVALADVVKVSESELDALAGDKGPAFFFDRGVSLLVITKGEAGCVYHTPHASGTVPGFAVRAVDTTGAGDGFVGGLLVQLAQRAKDRPWEDEAWLRRALRFANAVGALVTTKRGAIPALPTCEEVLAFLGA